MYEAIFDLSHIQVLHGRPEFSFFTYFWIIALINVLLLMRLKLDEVFEDNVSAAGKRMKTSGFKYNSVTLVVIWVTGRETSSVETEPLFNCGEETVINYCLDSSNNKTRDRWPWSHQLLVLNVRREVFPPYMSRLNP